MPLTGALATYLLNFHRETRGEQELSLTQTIRQNQMHDSHTMRVQHLQQRAGSVHRDQAEKGKGARLRANLKPKGKNKKIKKKTTHSNLSK